MTALHKIAQSTVFSNSSQLQRYLCNANPLFQGLHRRTLDGWFTFEKAKIPSPKKVFLDGMEACYNISLIVAKSGRRPIFSTDPEGQAAIEEFKRLLQDMRDAGVGLNLPAIRCLLVAFLVDKGLSHRLSPHLLDPSKEVDHAKFCCSHFWLVCFFSTHMHWS